MAKIVT